MKPKVLFVDDDPDVLEGLKRALIREPYEILTASSAVDAYGILDMEKIDVVVSDEQMPNISGTVFLTTVRKNYPEIIRIILTGQATLETAIQAINKGEVYRFLIKPCNNIEIAVTILQALRQRDLVRESRKLLALFKKQQKFFLREENKFVYFCETNLDENDVFEADDISDDAIVDNLITDIKKQTDTEE